LYSYYGTFLVTKLLMIMKKTLLLLLVSIFTFSANSQTNDSDVESYYKGIESYQNLRLTQEQIARIKKLKREKGPQFAAIGKDRNLSGYEKGQRKRELAYKYRTEMQSILNAGQVSTWEKRYGKLTPDHSMKDAISDDYDAKLDALERKYEADKDAIENNRSLDKYERKAREKELKNTYKAKKERLKAEKKTAKNRF